MRASTPFDDVQEITGRRVRLPELLLMSPHHSPLDNAAYALIDIMSGKNRGPIESRRDWLAGRLGCSLGGLVKSLNRLTADHQGDGPLEPDMPAFLTAEQRGQKLTALRDVVRFVPYVEVPEWTIGDELNGPLLTHREWRLYALYLHKRAPGRGTVAMRNAELAQLFHCRVETLAELDRALEAKGLLVVYRRSGRETVRLPVTVRIDQATRIDLLRRLAEDCGQLPILCGQDVDIVPGSVDKPAEPTPSAGSAPTPSTGSAPTPSTGSSIKRVPNYSDPNYVDPAVRRAAASRRADRSKSSHGVFAATAQTASCAQEVPGRASWRDMVSRGQVAEVDEARRARTRELIEQARLDAVATRSA